MVELTRTRYVCTKWWLTEDTLVCCPKHDSNKSLMISSLNQSLWSPGFPVAPPSPWITTHLALVAGHDGNLTDGHWSISVQGHADLGHIWLVQEFCDLHPCSIGHIQEVAREVNHGVTTDIDNLLSCPDLHGLKREHSGKSSSHKLLFCDSNFSKSKPLSQPHSRVLNSWKYKYFKANWWHLAQKVPSDRLHCYSENKHVVPWPCQRHWICPAQWPQHWTTCWPHLLVVASPHGRWHPAEIHPDPPGQRSAEWNPRQRRRGHTMCLQREKITGEGSEAKFEETYQLDVSNLQKRLHVPCMGYQTPPSDETPHIFPAGLFATHGFLPHWLIQHCYPCLLEQ